MNYVNKYLEDNTFLFSFLNNLYSLVLFSSDVSFSNGLGVSDVDIVCIE